MRLVSRILATLLALALPAWAGPVVPSTVSPVAVPVSLPTGAGRNPAMVWGWDARKGTLVGIWGNVGTDTRSTTRNRVDPVTGLWASLPANFPAFELIGGKYWLSMQPQTKNNLLNSETPATQTTASLATGTYTLWVEGSGSATSSAGTATITGGGAATAGTPNVFVVTVAGTVTVTVSGSPTRFQLNSTGVVQPYVVTAGATVTSNADAITWPSTAIKGGFTQTQGTAIVAWRPGYSYSTIPASQTLSIFSIKGDINNLCEFSSWAGSWFHTYDGTTSVSASVTLIAGNTYYVCTRWNSSGQTFSGLATGKFQIGYSTNLTNWTWGTPANYDGAFTSDGIVRLGYSTTYPHWFQRAAIYNRVLSVDEINQEFRK